MFSVLLSAWVLLLFFLPPADPHCRCPNPNFRPHCYLYHCHFQILCRNCRSSDCQCPVFPVCSPLRLCFQLPPLPHFHRPARSRSPVLPVNHLRYHRIRPKSTVPVSHRPHLKPLTLCLLLRSFLRLFGSVSDSVFYLPPFPAQILYFRSA